MGVWPWLVRSRAYEMLLSAAVGACLDSGLALDLCFYLNLLTIICTGLGGVNVSVHPQQARCQKRVRVSTCTSNVPFGDHLFSQIKHAQASSILRKSFTQQPTNEEGSEQKGTPPEALFGSSGFIPEQVCILARIEWNQACHWNQLWFASWPGKQWYLTLSNDERLLVKSE